MGPTKTMEVFRMDKYKMYEDIKAGKVYQGQYKRYERSYQNRQPGRRQWDYIISKVCIGCGKPLSRHENLKGLAFCFSCRQVLFPETINPYKYGTRRYFSRPLREHFP